MKIWYMFISLSYFVTSNFVTQCIAAICGSVRIFMVSSEQQKLFFYYWRNQLQLVIAVRFVTPGLVTDLDFIHQQSIFWLSKLCKPEFIGAATETIFYYIQIFYTIYNRMLEDTSLHTLLILLLEYVNTFWTHQIEQGYHY